MANRLVQLYRHETENDWDWFESYFTYSNSLLPEALLCAWLVTDELIYKEVAKSSFDFLISKTFYKNNFKVISNKGWLHKGDEIVPVATSGELPVDVSCIITALKLFYEVFKDENYKAKMDIAFNWFLGSNHLNHIIYNAGTGGCYDSLEENYISLNQGAEASVSYLIGRLAIGKTFEICRNNLPDTKNLLISL